MVRVKDSIVSLAGVLSAQIVLFGAVSFLGKHYGPSVLGQFNSYMAFGMLVGTVLGLRYELACVDPDPRKCLVALSNSVALAAVGAAALLCILWGVGRFEYVSVVAYAAAFFLSQAVSLTLNGLRKYYLIAASRVLVNSVFFLFVLVSSPSYLTSETTLLFLSAVTFAVCGAMALKVFKDEKVVFAAPSLRFFFDNQRFPKFTLPGTLLGSVVNYSLPIVIPVWYGGEAAGYFAIAYRFGYFPISLIAQSLGGVIRRDAMSALSDESDGHSLENVLLQYLKVLLVMLLGYVLFFVLFFRSAIVWYFGEQWATSADIFIAMIPLFAVQFIYIPMSQVFLATGHQKADFIVQVASFCILLGSLLISRLMGFELVQMIHFFSASGAAVLLLGLFLVRRAVMQPHVSGSKN